jgi:hypothetical protein
MPNLRNGEEEEINIMKKMFLGSLLLIVCLLSCSENKQSENSFDPNKHLKERFEISENNVIIKGRYGSENWKLESLIYEALKGRTGSYQVIILETDYDYYGKPLTKKEVVGTIDVDELNKFENFNSWYGRTGGVPGL